MRSKKRPDVLIVSKPVVPPWDDSAKNIVLYQVNNSRRYTYRVMTTRDSRRNNAFGDSPTFQANVVPAPIYDDGGKYAAGLAQNVRALVHGLLPQGARLYHYFFAPNKMSSTAGRVQKSIARVKSVQTVCSVPAEFENVSRLLFADRIVVLSENTKKRLEEAGVPAHKLRLVRPSIQKRPILGDDEKKKIRLAMRLPLDVPVVLFPGDLEFSSAAQTIADAVPKLVEKYPDIKVVFACRSKTPGAESIRARFERGFEQAGLADNVVFFEHVPRMPDFVGACDLVVLPADSLYAKMDTPLVLLEAMAQRVPLVLADIPPLDELLAMKCGLGVPPKDPGALVGAVARLLDDEQLRVETGRRGLAAINENFDPKRMAEQIEDIYDEVLAE